MPDPPGTQWLREQTAANNADPWAEAAKQWPFLANIPHAYARGPYPLESWPPGTYMSSPGFYRPKEIPMNQFGVSISNRSIRPIDVLGDVVSHGMRFSDPTIKAIYDQFAQSITPWQEKRLRDQYQWDREKEGEKRSYGDWRNETGLPGYFRAYPFQQWQKSEDPGEEDRTQEQVGRMFYTGEQIQFLDQMMRYLGKLK